MKNRTSIAALHCYRHCRRCSMELNFGLVVVVVVFCTRLFRVLGRMLDCVVQRMPWASREQIIVQRPAKVSGYRVWDINFVLRHVLNAWAQCSLHDDIVYIMCQTRFTHFPHTHTVNPKIYSLPCHSHILNLLVSWMSKEKGRPTGNVTIDAQKARSDPSICIRIRWKQTEITITTTSFRFSFITAKYNFIIFAQNKDEFGRNCWLQLQPWPDVWSTANRQTIGCHLWLLNAPKQIEPYDNVIGSPIISFGPIGIKCSATW